MNEGLCPHLGRQRLWHVVLRGDKPSLTSPDPGGIQKPMLSLPCMLPLPPPPAPFSAAQWLTDCPTQETVTRYTPILPSGSFLKCKLTPSVLRSFELFAGGGRGGGWIDALAS